MTGAQLKVIVDTSGKTQQEMADFIGISRGHLIRLMKASFVPDEYSTKVSRVTKSNISDHGNVAIMSGDTGIDAGGSVMVKDSPEYIEGYINMKGIGANDGAWLVTGHSMFPTISKGSRVIIKRINNLDTIVPGEIYVVDLKEHGGKVKRIKRSKYKGFWRLTSDNKEYDDMEVKIATDVLGVFRVLCQVELF